MPEKSCDSVNRHGGPRELYEIDDRAAATGPDRPSYILVICPTCNTRIHAAADQLGQPINCPDCDTQTFVLPPEPPESEPQETAPNEVVEEYALADEVEHAPGEVLPAEQTYFPVHCPKCNTLMKFSEEQVGQEAVCPDCLVPLTVPPAPEGRVERDLDLWSADLNADERAGRTGRSSVEEGPRGSAGDREYILAVCPVCNTRLHPTFDQVGRQIVCPDCEKPFVVQPPKQRPPARRAKAHDPDEASESPRVRVVDDYRRLDKDGEISEVEQPEPVGRTRLRRSNVPDRPFLSGVFTFPFYSGCWPRWLGLSLGLWGVLYLMMNALECAALGGKYLPFAMIYCGMAGICGVVWGFTSIGFGVAVLRDTAAGNDQIEDWPSFNFLDWWGDCFFVINSAALCALLELGLSWALGESALVGGLMIAVSLGLFPVFFLSMVEAQTPMDPFSLPIWKSLFTVWSAWGAFYVMTTLLTFLIALGWWQIGMIHPYSGMVFGAIVVVPGMMIYFRLLGRLAWCCQRKSELDNLAAEDDEEMSNEQ